MNCATAFRFLILVIPAAWVVFRLLPAEHPRYGLAVRHDTKVVVNKFSSTLITRRCTWTI